ncbi:oligosaccharide flippase family protein [Streptococcus suis]|uniref:oligosaccharide flippase family protein n=1 Tax=Streptococcus suis TaxID=1307 RepID=UPI001EE11FFB|nr:oligosaccharide flippase family protein [Streptococcus suis]QCO71578.1 Wzx [Streptococcus suis]
MKNIERPAMVNYKKMSLYYMFGTLFNQGLSFLTIPFFSRMLTTFDYGIINTYTSWVAILFMITSCALHMGIRAEFVDNEKNIDGVMSSVTSFTLLNSFIVSVIILVGAYIFGNGNILLIVFCLIQSIATGLINNYTMYLMMQYRYKFRTFLLVVPNLLAITVAFILIIFILKSDLYFGRIIPWSLVQGLFGILIIWLVYSKSQVFWNKKYIKSALAISMPLVLHGIAINILSQSDRVMITALRNASETGIYSLVYNLGMLAIVITYSMEGVWVPWFTRRLKEGEEAVVNDRAKIYIELIALAMGLLILIGPEVIRILSDSKYWEGITIIPPIILANYLMFAETLYVNVEHFYKKSLSITFNTTVAAAVNIVANFLFIPQYGYVAAAYTTLFSYIVSFLLHANYSKKLNSSLYPLIYFSASFLKLSIIMILFYVFFGNIIIRWLIAFCLFIYEAFRFKEVILSLLPSSIRNKFCK